uniref:Integrase catalytic domain-containing protein n=1 Tax=Anopheles quadriannulatus TaxID=34691 RepID=A0A182XPK3_ANOQN
MRPEQMQLSYLEGIAPQQVSTVCSIVPNAAQNAARHVWPKKLPTFSGDPEEWPVFIRAYEDSTIACGFTAVENAIRLEECLRGPARELIRPKLRFPNATAAAIETMPAYKMEGSDFSEKFEEPTLKEFGMYMKKVVTKASRVATLSTSKEHGQVEAKVGRNVKGHVNVHDSSKGSTTTKLEPRKCFVCSSTEHVVRGCREFIESSPIQRLQTVERLKLCRKCLSNHSIEQCKTRYRCYINGCHKDDHHTLLHQVDVPQAIIQFHEKSKPAKSTLFKVVPVTLYNGDKQLETLAFIDEGSSLTLVESSVARKLGAEGITEPLQLAWTSDVTRTEPTSQRINLKISAQGVDTNFPLVGARTVQSLKLPVQGLDHCSISKYEHLRGIPVLNYGPAEPKVLIGLQNINLIAPIESRIGEPGEPIAVRSVLGWSVFPIILPKSHDLTRLILQEYHCKYGHSNSETVVNEVRQRFYVPNLRTMVSKAARDCQRCKIAKCQPQAPRMAPLPEQRLTPHVRPFSRVGIDYLGPIEVSVGRTKVKRYVAVFTCLVVRAIHLELVYDLSANACIMAIRRFVCRRGPPLEIFSDNGTNFVGASNELKKQLSEINNDCAETFTNTRTAWQFNPPAAPHMGGVWERLVRSVKEALTVLQDGRKLTDEILKTVLAESENLINSRPLTYVPQSTSDNEALTPNHFLLGSSSGSQDQAKTPTELGDALRNSYHRTQFLTDEFWKRWQQEYFPTLNRRTKWFNESKPVAEGDLVYVADGERRTWIRGRIQEVFKGKDGRIRSATVQTARGSTLKRPVHKLAVMEV